MATARSALACAVVISVSYAGSGFSRIEATSSYVGSGFSRIDAVGLKADATMTATTDLQSPTYGVGRTPTADELKAIDIDVLPDGRGLPPGHGTAASGKAIYASRCAVCHGATGKEGPQDVIAGGRGSLKAPARPLKTVGSYWPYATTLWDYLRRAMPFDHPGTMSTDDLYSTTAYVLFLNGIVGEADVIDETTLPKVRMPNRDGFTRDPRPDTITNGTKTQLPAR